MDTPAILLICVGCRTASRLRWTVGRKEICEEAGSTRAASSGSAERTVWTLCESIRALRSRGRTEKSGRASSLPRACDTAQGHRLSSTARGSCAIMSVSLWVLHITRAFDFKSISHNHFDFFVFVRSGRTARRRADGIRSNRSLLPCGRAVCTVHRTQVHGSRHVGPTARRAVDVLAPSPVEVLSSRLVASRLTDTRERRRSSQGMGDGVGELGHITRDTHARRSRTLDANAYRRHHTSTHCLSSPRVSPHCIYERRRPRATHDSTTTYAAALSLLFRADRPAHALGALPPWPRPSSARRASSRGHPSRGRAHLARGHA